MCLHAYTTMSERVACAAFDSFNVFRDTGVIDTLLSSFTAHSAE